MLRTPSNLLRLRCLVICGRSLRCSSTSNSSEGSGNNFIVRSPFPDKEIPKGITIPEYLQATMGPWIRSTAFECGLSGRKLSYSEVFRQSRSFGAALLQSGFKKGDVIGIVLQNVPEYCPVLFGIWEAGLCACPVNPQYTPAEIRRQLSIAGAKGVVTSAEFIEGMKAAVQKNPSSPSFIVNISNQVHENTHSFSEMVQTNPGHARFEGVTEESSVEDTVLLPFSSGTTGLPKGVCLTHYNLLANLIQISSEEFAYRPRLGATRERFIGVLPFFHSYGFMVFLSLGLYKGAHTLCLPKFEPKLFLSSVRSHKPTSLHLVPPLIALINNSNEYSKHELESVECVMVGAAPVGPALIQTFFQKKGKEFYFLEGYGMTELSPVTHLMVPSLTNPVIGSCGVPLPNTICRVVDVESGKSLGPNLKGEIQIKGPQRMKGYFNNEEATRATIDSEGWLHTGDIGYYDQNSSFFIVDRIKELIKVKGFQVAPSELEDLLRGCVGVEDVAVIGIPHTEFGEVPLAYIVPSSPTLTPDGVNSYLQSLVANYKQLRGGIEFVESIPKAPSGKLLRRELVEKYRNRTET